MSCFYSLVQVEDKSQNFPSDTCIMEKTLILTTERRPTLNLQTEILSKIFLISNLEIFPEKKNSKVKVQREKSSATNVPLGI